jgi:poly-gamma-glutamate capsule biosynthesis protein CapA/YwtB (metallophosphatase superfamily)
LLEKLSCEKLICGINNNHIMDYGKDGLEDTINYLDKNKIKYFGAGCETENITKVQELIINNKKIIILGFTLPDPGTFNIKDNECGTLNYYDYKEQIKKYKKECDYLIVSIHGGIEFITLPSPTIKKIYKNIINQGADVIIGHHPHVPQGYEKYNDGLIFYSLGNFVFDLEYHKSYKHTNKGYFVKLQFEGGIDFEIIPISKNEDNFIDIDNSVMNVINDSSKLINAKEYKSIWATESYKRLFPSLIKNKNKFSVQSSKNNIKVSKANRIINKLKHMFTLLNDTIQKDMVLGAIQYILFYKKIK